MAERIQIEFSDEAEPGLKKLGKTAAQASKDMDSLAKSGKRVGDALSESSKATGRAIDADKQGLSLRSQLLSVTDRLFIATQKVGMATRILSHGFQALSKGGTESADQLAASMASLRQSMQKIADGPTGEFLAGGAKGFVDAVDANSKAIEDAYITYPQTARGWWIDLKELVGATSKEEAKRQREKNDFLALAIKNDAEFTRKKAEQHRQDKAIAHDRFQVEQEIAKLKDSQRSRENQAFLERALNSRLLRAEEKDEQERVKRLILEENKLKRDAAKLSEEEGKKLLEQAANLARQRANAAQRAEQASAKAFELEKKRADAIEATLRGGRPGSKDGLPPVAPRPQFGLIGSGFENLSTYRGQPTHRRTGSSIEEAYRRMQASGDQQTGTDAIAEAVVQSIDPKKIRRVAVMKAVKQLEAERIATKNDPASINIDPRKIDAEYDRKIGMERQRILRGVGRGPLQRGITGDEIADAQTELVNKELGMLQEKGKVDRKTLEVIKKQTQVIIQNGAQLKDAKAQLDQLQSALQQYLRTAPVNNRARAQVAGIGN